jgi:hypothetical protein
VPILVIGGGRFVGCLGFGAPQLGDRGWRDRLARRGLCLKRSGEGFHVHLHAKAQRATSRMAARGAMAVARGRSAVSPNVLPSSSRTAESLALTSPPGGRFFLRWIAYRLRMGG